MWFLSFLLGLVGNDVIGYILRTFYLIFGFLYLARMTLIDRDGFKGFIKNIRYYDFILIALFFPIILIFSIFLSIGFSIWGLFVLLNKKISN